LVDRVDFVVVEVEYYVAVVAVVAAVAMAVVPVLVAAAADGEDMILAAS
jgi:hypothetical protein